MAASEVFENLPSAAQSAIREAEINGYSFFRAAASRGVTASFIIETAVFRP
jgi:hypothetical protein